MKDWAILGVTIPACFTVLIAYGYFSFRKAQRRLAERRPNPTRDEFVALLTCDDEDVATWLWETAIPYYRPLTPHPDDHLIRDARIDDDDVTMDWLPQFAKSRGLRWKHWPDWPKDWELTVRNYARWLQLGVDATRTAKTTDPENA